MNNRIGSPLVKRILSLALFPLLCLAPAMLSAPPACAGGPPAMSLDLDHGSGAVNFDAIGKPSAIKIHGKGDAPHGQIQVKDGKATGAITFKLDSLDTAINMRNEHMKKRYLETDKYPEAKLTLTQLDLPATYAAADFSATDIPFTGTLTLHGVEKPVTGTVKLGRNGSDMAIEAKFPLKIEDYGIKVPSFAGITMASEVNIAVESKAPFKAF